MLTHHVFTLNSLRSEARVPVYRCTKCDAYFSEGGVINYDESDLISYYAPHEAYIKERFARVFTEVGHMMLPGRFLDIGAGMGYSLEVANHRGWSSHGLEPNRVLVESAVKRGLSVERGYLVDTTCGEYDLILIDNVLEHVPDPVGFLCNAMRLLAPSGLMVIAIPPMDWVRKALAALPYVRNQVRKPQLNIFRESDEHLNMLGRRAMTKLAQRVGLTPLSVRFHHSRVFNNLAFRFLGLDDGYYFLSTGGRRQ